MEDEAQYKKVATEKKKIAEDDCSVPHRARGSGVTSTGAYKLVWAGTCPSSSWAGQYFHFPQLPRLLGRFHQQQPSPSPSHPFPTPFSARILLHPIRPVEIQRTVRHLSILTACLGRDTLLLSRYLEYDTFILSVPSDLTTALTSFTRPNSG